MIRNTILFSMFKTVICTFLILVAVSCGPSKNTTPIADQDFNADWLFLKDSIDNGQHMAVDDSQWRKLNLPHDWAIEGPFDGTHNARTGGLPVHGEAWYRKHFTIDKQHKDKQIAIEFDGAMSNAKVWLNGTYIGERPYGYIGFEFDLTPHLKFGEDNVIAVQLSPEDLAARWYPGAGIYRNVRLKINADVHIPQWGTYITTPKISNEKATVSINTDIRNTKTVASEIVLETVIKNEEGTVVANTTSNLVVLETSLETVSQTLEIPNPIRWDLFKSYLYTVESTLIEDGKPIDTYESHFGIRTIDFDADKGFSLNGKPVEFQGVCMHHDLGPLGAAVNYRAVERQLEKMVSMGINALRTSHNPPSPEVLQVCDKLGIVVIDEAFDEWQIGKVPNGYNKYFDEWHEKDLRDMIRRDRNHPSVIMWSIGNEILEQQKEDGWKLTKRLNDICHDEDDMRPTTIGFNYYPNPFENQMAYNVDVVGMNYHPRSYKEIREQNPDLIFYGSETSSMTSSRGVYHLPIEADEQHDTNHVSSYDVITGPRWTYPPDAEFDAQAENPYSLGEFMWTGFDYLGEPTPYGGSDNFTNGYWNDDWPSRSSYFGPVDLAGFAKDRYYLYQSQWTDEPMVHVLPHWNWKGQEGKTIPVFSYTNCDEVELFVNGKSFGKKTKGVDMTEIPAYYHRYEEGTMKSKYRLSWKVPYQPGSLKVVGYKDGKSMVEKEIKTAGTPTNISLEADRTQISADGKDLSFITVRIEDGEGNLCPLADHNVNFEVSGAGKLEAVGNGDPTSMDSFQADSRKAFSGQCLLIVRSSKNVGDIQVRATAEGLAPASIVLKVE